MEVPSSQDGYQALLGLVAERAPGRRCWALEGTGCYGAGLASFLADQGEWVVEIDRPKRPRTMPSMVVAHQKPRRSWRRWAWAVGAVGVAGVVQVADDSPQPG
jgi:hypothetical protein